MSNAIDDAAEFLEQAAANPSPRPLAKPQAEPSGFSSEKERARPGAPSQWAIYGPGYKATTPTISELAPGCYDIMPSDQGPFAAPALPPSGLLLELPEMRSEHVIQLVERFWNSEKDYKEGNEFIRGGAAYRCGIMLYGAPGTGKSCTIKLVSKKLIERGGTVFYSDLHPQAVQNFLGDFARIERNRKCVVILEDFDSLIQSYGEACYLQMLDSGKTVDNIMFIATTNYPERLDPRIYNRPGRFSHIVKIGLPSAPARRAYLKAVLKNHRDVETIVEMTEGFSIDHLSALISGVYREKKDLHDEIARLRTLFKVPKAGEQGPLGIAS